jgi:hypothetical protein
MDGEASESFQTYTQLIYKYLDIALDCGIREVEFWEMTLSELERYVLSWQRTKEVRAKEQAAFDYILASLVGINVASFFGEVKVPTLAEVYSHLFKEQAEEVQEKKSNVQDELSALRFKQFAKSYNEKFYKQEVAIVSE